MLNVSAVHDQKYVITFSLNLSIQSRSSSTSYFFLLLFCKEKKLFANGNQLNQFISVYILLSIWEWYVLLYIYMWIPFSENAIDFDWIIFIWWCKRRWTERNGTNEFIAFNIIYLSIGYLIAMFPVYILTYV